MTTKTLPAPVEVTTPILPSEALRLGRLTRPVHVRATLFDGEQGACALGAMLTGWGVDPSSDEAMDMYTASQILKPMGVSAAADIALPFDNAERRGGDGDAYVLAYLAERGL